MYLLALNGKQFINTDFVERFCVVKKGDATLIVASYSDQRPPVTVGRYLTEEEAKGNLFELFAAICGEQSNFIMPDSLMYYEEQIKKNARTKRKGGS